MKGRGHIYYSELEKIRFRMDNVEPSWRYGALRSCMEVLVKDAAGPELKFQDLKTAIDWACYRYNCDPLRNDLQNTRWLANRGVHGGEEPPLNQLPSKVHTVAKLVAAITGDDLPPTLLPQAIAPAEATPDVSITQTETETLPHSFRAVFQQVEGNRLFVRLAERANEPNPLLAADDLIVLQLPADMAKVGWKDWKVVWATWLKQNAEWGDSLFIHLEADSPRQAVTESEAALNPDAPLPHIRYLVYLPDYLVDITTLAGAWKEFRGEYTLRYWAGFQRLVESQDELNLHLFRGNLANQLLDDLFLEPSEAPQTTFSAEGYTFQLSPWEAFLLKLRIPDKWEQLTKELAAYFNQLKAARDVSIPYRIAGWDWKLVEKPEAEAAGTFVLEPSFLAEEYGLQGRLDILYRKEQKGEKDRLHIIEMKTGKAPYELGGEGALAIREEHKAQALLYHLMMLAVHAPGEVPDIDSSILYSALGGKPTAVRPVEREKETEMETALMFLRNQMVKLEQRLCSPDKIGPYWEKLLQLGKSQQLDNFDNPVWEGLSNIWSKLTLPERAYWLQAIRFSVTEKWYAKVGTGAQNPGHALLWQSNIAERVSQQLALADLTYEDFPESDWPAPVQELARAYREELRHGDEKAILVFRISEAGVAAPRFRPGDTVLLYPGLRQADKVHDYSPTHSILLKCDLVAVDNERVYLLFRHTSQRRYILQRVQRNPATRWALDADTLESSLNKPSSYLHRFFRTYAHFPEQRQLWLGQRPPAAIGPTALTEGEPADIVRAAIQARDYFLIQGPPGTGKTREVLGPLVAELVAAGERVLVCSYTNRALDELSEAIVEKLKEKLAEPKRHFVRWGRRINCKPEFHPYLESTLALGAEKPEDLAWIFEPGVAHVGTVHTLLGKAALFNVPNTPPEQPHQPWFDTLILDEASQVLEPYFLGLVPFARRAILIGDPMQLPAVVTQHKENSSIKHPELNQLGITNLRNSWFERMYWKIRQTPEWHHALGLLTRQGRMHPELEAFPSHYFYGGKLTAVGLYHQTRGLECTKEEPLNAVEELVQKRRLVFLQVEGEEEQMARNPDINEKEAQAVAQLVAALERLRYPDTAHQTVGIITPWRKQIPIIRNHLRELKLTCADSITIDTVERYQGSSREVIVLSCCINTPAQLVRAANPGSDGKDRKLNVALTRAREQLFILGNEALLNQSQDYRALIAHCREQSAGFEWAAVEGVAQVA